MGITIQDALVMAAFAHYNRNSLIYYDSKTWAILVIRSASAYSVVSFMWNNFQNCVTDSSISGSHPMGYMEAQSKRSLDPGVLSLLLNILFFFSLFKHQAIRIDNS